MTLNSDCKKSFLRKIFSPNRRKTTAPDPLDLSALLSDSRPPSLCGSDSSTRLQPLSVFVATWNVGGKSPHDGVNLDDYFQIFSRSDIYVLGFQEIVPLNAGNVLVVEDNEPAVKWLSCINRSLNKSRSEFAGKKKPKSSIGFPKPAFKKFCENFRTESARRLKSCNCECSSDEEEEGVCSGAGLEYGMVMAKQMVGIFLTIWAKREIVWSIRHLRVSCTGRGIMGCLGNKGCISVSLTVHQTNFCFVCSHLASGEKDGDELRRNSDVIEILKTTQFRRNCKSPNNRVPEKIVDHDRVLWLGDLNYRIALSYAETRKLVENNDWDTLFDNDQLKREREAGRVFSGWREGKICFAPTYKYSYNSDTYAGETEETRRKRRTPAWCDRILWREKGITQVNYERLESKFSDHRPVCSTFLIDVDVIQHFRH